MDGFVINIEEATLNNIYYRRVIDTTDNQQLVLMSIPIGEDIPMETHPYTTQFIRFEAGEADVILNGKTYKVKDGVSVTIHPGTEHQIINSSLYENLKLYTIYSPPEHPRDTIQMYKP